VQFSDIHDNTSRLAIGALGLSLLGLLSLGVNRVVNALKGRKDLTMPRYNSRALICAPASGVTRGAAAGPAPSKKDGSAAAKAEDKIAASSAASSKAKQLTVTGIFEIVGRVKRPALDDQLVYLDE